MKGEPKTVIIKDTTNRKLRRLQAQYVRKTHKSISFSKIVNIVLKEGLKSKKRSK